MSAWVSLVFRAKLVPGESVLILGATGVTGKLAIRIAKLLGAARVVAAGRNQQVLSTLPELGADAIIWLGTSDNELRNAFAGATGSSGFQVVLDYLWGRPVEVLLSAMTRKEFVLVGSETRLVQVGESPRFRSQPPSCGAARSQFSVLLEFHLVMFSLTLCRRSWRMLPVET